ncbi:MAG: ribonuclease HII, partial [Synergistetes bacterium]|nr:ribonuclease HII [Synergistota bacterium]MDW8192309.1 ribonuclease HII [Synergistota bacterium]
MNSLLVAGVDEAGRGPLAGPVVAAALILPYEYFNDEVRDCKKLSPCKREELFEILRKKALAWAVALVTPEEIDKMNILNASLEAMRRAILKLKLKPDIILVDGNHKIPLIDIPQRAIPKGDEICLPISAASIIAKVIRDRIMCAWDRIYPEYGFSKHKGYPTK